MNLRAQHAPGRFVLSVILGFVLSTPGAFASTLDPILIDRGVDQPIRIAVVPFKTAPSLQSEANVADIIAFDLARSGQFDPLAAENMLSHPNDEKGVFFRDWRILKAAYLVIGNAQPNVDGRIDLNFELFDVLSERRVQGVRYTIDRSQWREVAHRIADSVYEQITGVRGAFATKLMYVLAKNAGSPDATYNLEIADSDGETI